MADQRLTELFDGIVAKRLAPVEVVSGPSNQHELNGIAPVLSVFGRPDGKLRIPTQFVRLDDSDASETALGQLTLYDARAGDPNRSAEYRLYYDSNPVMLKAEATDLFILARRRNSDAALAVMAPAGSSAELQLEWLFGLDAQLSTSFVTRDADELHESQLDISRRLVLDAIEEVIPAPTGSLLDLVVAEFGLEFPTTRMFSAFARSTLPEVSADDGADAAIVAWMSREEELFSAFSSHLLSEQLQLLIEDSGTPPDPSPFQSLMLSHQNRSKSRAGHALENHLEAVFTSLGVPYSRGHETENGATPDFVFPGGEAYDDPAFDDSRLTMLAAKRTLKDRWRQVLTEAERIPAKHLITLQAPISSNQTDEMRAHHVQLVVPTSLHEAFSPDQQSWLIGLDEFIDLVRSRLGG